MLRTDLPTPQATQRPLLGSGLYDGRPCSQNRNCQLQRTFKQQERNRAQAGLKTQRAPKAALASHLCTVTRGDGTLWRSFLCDQCARRFCQLRGLTFRAAGVPPTTQELVP